MPTSTTEPYLWVAVLGVIAGFAMAFGIGANDVANAFGTSVAAKSVTLKQAVIIASVFEFGGAYFLGASVTGTIRSKIVDVDIYSDQPGVLMYGMLTSLITSTLILGIATVGGFPVSTTHTIVGAIIGFSIAAEGFDSINWDTTKDIFVSWITSPLITGTLALILFLPLRLFVLRSEHAFARAILTYPIVLTAGIGINLFYVLKKATANLKVASDIPLSIVLPVSFGTGALCGLVFLVFVGPRLKIRIENKAAEKAAAAEAKLHTAEEEEAEKIETPVVDGEEDAQDVESSDGDEQEGPIKEPTPATDVKPTETPSGNVFSRGFEKFAQATYKQDLHAQSMHEGAHTEEMWDNAEQFDPNAEALFSYLQVFTACMTSFAHGANDVANAIAPVSAIVEIYKSGEVSSKSEVQKWVLALGGAGLVLGLLLYGYKVMMSIGFHLTAMSPSRGTVVELSTALVVVTSSFLGLPVSSTQCVTGAVAGVGLAGGHKNVQWMFLAKVCVSWVVTFVAVVIVSAGVFSFGAYGPTLVPSN